MKRVFLARHGETHGNREGYDRYSYLPEFAASKDILRIFSESKKPKSFPKKFPKPAQTSMNSLTDLGRFQASILGKFFQRKLSDNDVYFLSSDLERAVDTTRIVAREMKQNLDDTYRQSPLIREIPSYSGSRFATGDTLECRATQAVNDFVSEMSAIPQDTVIAISHGNLISAILRMKTEFLAEDPDFIEFYNNDHLFENCGFYELEFDGQTFYTANPESTIYTPFSRMLRKISKVH